MTAPSAPAIPYGRDYITDWWCDRDGRVYRGAGPYQHRPLRRLRRAMRPYSTRWLR